jgi:hypothetical protein
MVSEGELDELLSTCPVLYHMAEGGSWPSIVERGLLSTAALLDLYGVSGRERLLIEERHRPAGITLTHPVLPKAVIRDQLPMDDAGLRRCLPPHLAPSDWYRLLNQKVFFWLTRDGLLRLLGAEAYRANAHDVLEVDARLLVRAYFDAIWLSPMNSGCTKPMPHPRGDQTFLRIGDYPYAEWRRKRRRGERVVELAVDYAVRDISSYVRRVVVMRNTEELEEVYRA